eukprot:CAMPEP_0197047628 /NCGR_PEP_ID=MMETSP1384-20130603/23100_1 /TAXON_ID=29189 /ORGANISM="Ammonia sp." /LENGTH=382 /DNA_ID=CAMNT_0042479587 /DNA_START=114 /DNA_END=1262 /DNA_ORIENTATION=-
MKGFFRTFSAAFIFKTSLRFFTTLFAGKLSWKRIRAIFLDNDSVLFGFFVGLMSFTYKVILCALRRIRKKDPIYHKTIAGFLSGLWILIDDKTRRQQIALYCLVRAIADLVKLGVVYKRVPDIPHSDVAVFTVSQFFIMHGLMHASHTLDRGYYKWIKKMGDYSEEQIQLTFRSRVNPKAQYRLPSEQWDTCYPLFHRDPSCLRHHSIGWLFALFRAAQIYLPVHVLPMILFKPKKVLQDPLQFLRRKAFNVMVSSVFLATYQFNMKITICTLRNWFKTDHWSHDLMGGFTTGMALFLENEYRRPELMLYCAPRAIEVAYRLIPNSGYFRGLYQLSRWTYLPVLSFQVAMAVWMTVIAIPKGEDTSNSINMTVLKIIFGSKH